MKRKSNDINGVESGTTYVLYVENGFITCLEGTAFGDEMFPEKIEWFRIRNDAF